MAGPNRKNIVLNIPQEDDERKTRCPRLRRLYFVEPP